MRDITYAILACDYCISKVQGKLVPGEGNIKAKMVLIGEAPGRKEDETGRPFIGASGLLLERTLDQFGIRRKDIFITSVLKYFPGKRTIRWEEILHGRTHLMEQLSCIHPSLLVLMGSVALRALTLDKNISITKKRGEESLISGYRCIPTFHPAAILRVPPLMSFFISDMELIGGLYKNIVGSSY